MARVLINKNGGKQMPKLAERLNDKQVMALTKKEGLHPVGGCDGLYLSVKLLKSGRTSCSWVIRIQRKGVKGKKSLGTYPTVSLMQARQMGKDVWGLVYDGLNPFEYLKQKQIKLINEEKERKQQAINFEDLFDEFLEYKASRDWKEGSKRGRDIKRFILTYCEPLLDRALANITTEDIAKTLAVIWSTKPKTAEAIQNAIKQYFDWAMYVKHCLKVGSNPADLRVLGLLLPSDRKRKETINQPAIPVERLPELVRAITAKSEMSARCLEFALLTCVRGANARKAKWEQFNDDLTVWTIDSKDMKIRKNGQHVIPLSRQATELLMRIKASAVSNKLVFPSDMTGCEMNHGAMNDLIKRSHEQEIKLGREGWIDREQSARFNKPMIVTPHGVCRATFKTWAEDNKVDPLVSELILHHNIGDRYNRVDRFEFKKRVLQDWADFCYSLINK